MANIENAKFKQPAQVCCSAVLADIERAINHAYESGYISGHNDTCEGCFSNDTSEVAKDRAAEIVQAITAHLSANVKSSVQCSAKYDHDEVRCDEMADWDCDNKMAGEPRTCCVCAGHDCAAARAERLKHPARISPNI